MKVVHMNENVQARSDSVGGVCRSCWIQPTMEGTDCRYMSYRSLIGAVVILLLAVGARPGLADVVWSGIDWTTTDYSTPSTATLSVDTNTNYLTVTPNGTDVGWDGDNQAFGFAHSERNLPAGTEWVSTSFIYDATATNPNNGDTLNAQLWMEQNPNFWVEGGAYNHAWLNSSAPWPIASAVGFNAGWTDEQNPGPMMYLGPPTSGLHTAVLGETATGITQFWFDGALAWTATDPAPLPFLDIYLTAGNGPITFTDFQYGTNYQDNIDPVPEPETWVLLVTAGLGALAYAWLRRRNA